MSARSTADKVLMGFAVVFVLGLIGFVGLKVLNGANDAGAEACTAYRDALADDPSAITSFEVMPKIKDMLSDLDDPTRRAFAALISADETNPYMPGADPDVTRDAAAEVRTVCLAEHGVEIAG